MVVQQRASNKRTGERDRPHPSKQAKVGRRAVPEITEDETDGATRENSGRVAPPGLGATVGGEISRLTSTGPGSPTFLRQGRNGEQATLLHHSAPPSLSTLAPTPTSTLSSPVRSFLRLRFAALSPQSPSFAFARLRLTNGSLTRDGDPTKPPLRQEPCTDGRGVRARPQAAPGAAHALPGAAA